VVCCPAPAQACKRREWRRVVVPAAGGLPRAPWVLLMLPLMPPLAEEQEQERLRYLEAHGLPDDWQPDPEDLDPWFLSPNF